MTTMKPFYIILMLMLVHVMVIALSEDASQRTESGNIKLRPTDKVWVQKKPIAPLPISSDRLLATAGDTLYILDPQKKVVWKWCVGNGANIVDQPITDATGTLYVIALDGQLFALDSCGKEKWHYQMNGSANFSQIKNYKRDQVLVVVDMKPYRETKGIDTEDKLFLFRDKEIIAEKEFPRNSLLQVWGEKVLAAKQTKDGIEIIEVPL